jgi:hypothetical protein
MKVPGPHMKVYVVFLMNDRGAVNDLLGFTPPVMPPIRACADGRVVVGRTSPSVHEPAWLNHQVLFARNSAVTALAGSATTNSDANATANATNIGASLWILRLAIGWLPLLIVTIVVVAIFRERRDSWQLHCPLTDRAL